MMFGLILLFSAQPLLEFSCVFACSFATVDLINDLQENQRKATLSLLANAKEICAKHGIIAEMATEVGEPKEAICEAAEKLDIQLLILGSHGRGAIQRAFLGSVSDYCVHNAKCPVLVVKRPA
ncbi:universal stress protein A-like protein [Syzygium oleosum]|uniref:universal stress protein A-like protein n=1 Tax=Syzygium oleosum TaxID=219896 RepID=UPI0024BAFB49|nr:universal stress protein A-like protein [Syzygium oleosum]